MKYLAYIGLLMIALPLGLVSLPASAAPLLRETLSTADLANQAQTNAQSRTEQQIHIAVIGEVQIPGAYSLPNSAPPDERFAQSRSLATVTRALQVAGGITPLADVRQVQIRRQASDGSIQMIDVDLYKYLSREDLSQDIRLQDGDAVVVPFAQ